MTMVDKETWHNWLDETGYIFDIAEFYYERDGDQARFPIVQVALWLGLQPNAMQSFLTRFEPDSDDIELARSEISKLHDDFALAVLQRWIATAEMK